LHTLPENKDGLWEWDRIIIVERPGLGKHFQMLKPKQGDLIPSGGGFTTFTDESRMQGEFKNIKYVEEYCRYLWKPSECI
jgi:hypothetical protein